MPSDTITKETKQNLSLFVSLEVRIWAYKIGLLQPYPKGGTEWLKLLTSLMLMKQNVGMRLHGLVACNIHFRERGISTFQIGEGKINEEINSISCSCKDITNLATETFKKY